MKTLLSWSSGKDCAWALHTLRQQPEIELVGLLTTINEEADRVAMHGVRHELLRAQAEAAGLPLWPVDLPWPCSNEQYQAIMAAVVERAGGEGVQAMAFGDLHLADIRAYRERQLEGTGLQPLFPIWGGAADTPALARRMVEAGLRATLVCVDTAQLSADFLGRTFDEELLADLPDGVDPCGENGEFHTFCFAGPMFSAPLPVRLGERVEKGQFHYVDLLP
jgi:uncharacterized protein (TIGR00290 family)